MRFEITDDDAEESTEAVAPGTSSCYPGGAWNYPECCTSGNYAC